MNGPCAVLVVEEDGVLAEITAFRLELLGYQVEIAESAGVALEGLARRLPDVIVLNLSLSGTNGLEFVNQLSNDVRTSRIPVLVLSTTGDLNEVQRVYAAGAKDYVVIPYDPAVLQHKIERLVDPAGAACS